MVTQGVLEFQYQPDNTKTGLTANAGLPLYLDLAFRAGLVESLRRHLEVRRGGQGWTDEQVVLSLVLMKAPSAPLVGLQRVSAELVGYAQQCRPSATATLDMDATLVQSHKREALYCCQGMRAYQPLNTWWAEQGMMLHTQPTMRRLNMSITTAR